MKKCFVILLIILCSSHLNAKREVFAHSFMYTKPGYYDIVMEQALWHDIEFNKKGTIRGGLQAIPFFQQSTPLDKNARYFLMHGKTELLVAGDDTPSKSFRDIRAEWVNLPSNFTGTLSVNPKQQQHGCLLEYHQDLLNWFDIRFLRDMYIMILMPIEEVKNQINLTQTNVSNPSSTFPHNIIEAFNQPSWCFSRIDNCQKRKIGVAELTIKIGTSYISEDYFQLNYYSVLAIPTGNKQDGKTMFEPINGNNHHLGIGAGIIIQAPLNRDTTDFAWCGFLELESVILIRNKQWRTYDLFDKPWSRFLLMNVVGTPEPASNQPGVNYMTQRITAKPFNIVDFALGWRLHTQCVEAEIGYGIWGHSTERTNLKQPSPVDVFGQVLPDGSTVPVTTTQQIAFGIAGSAPGKTASRSTIAFQAPDDLEFVPIQTSDLDRQSGESFGGFTQRAFTSIGWLKKGDTIDGIIGLGGSIDIPFHNSLLQLWKIWIKLGATF